MLRRRKTSGDGRDKTRRARRRRGTPAGSARCPFFLREPAPHPGVAFKLAANGRRSITAAHSGC
jgi:hypothetical protein